MRICILGGGGNVAEAVACQMSGRGHDVVQFRFNPHVPVPGVPERPARSSARLETTQLRVVDPQGLALEGYRPRWITSAEFAGVDVFVFAFPSYMAEPVGRLLGRQIAGRPLVNLSDRFLGTYDLVATARRWHGPDATPSFCVAFNGVPIMAQKASRDAPLTVFYFKRGHSVACYPFTAVEPARELLEECFGIRPEQIRHYETMIHLAFENTHCIEHAVVDLGNLRLGLYTGDKNLYSRALYRKDALERIDRIVCERDLVARRVVGRSFASLAEYDTRVFGVSTAPGDDLAGTVTYRIEHDALGRAPSPEWWGAFGFEDNGWSMVTLESVGRLFNIHTPELSRLIDEWCRFGRTDYRKVGRTLTSLAVTPRPERLLSGYADLHWLPAFDGHAAQLEAAS